MLEDIVWNKLKIDQCNKIKLIKYIKDKLKQIKELIKYLKLKKDLSIIIIKMILIGHLDLSDW